jgi:hypothetical protein
MFGWRFRLESVLFQSVFVFAGLAMCSMPLVTYYKAQRTTYAVTDRRVLIVVTGRKREVQSYGALDVNAIERQEAADASGDLTFVRRKEKDSEGRDRTVEVKFIGIPKVREVERLLRSVFTPGG